MKIQIDHEFLDLSEQILKESHSLEEWREIESDDMFQTPHYEGGSMLRRTPSALATMILTAANFGFSSHFRR